MYITISPQKIGPTFSRSAADFVAYLEKENLEKTPELQEAFFNQTEENISGDRVIAEIDGNGAKLKKSEPKYYSLTINPSRRELEHLGNNTESLKAYTREIMKAYAAAFNREIHGRPVNVDDIKYFAKIEFHRTFKGTDREIKENAPFIKRIAALENQIQKIQRGEIPGNLPHLKKELERTRELAPHKSNGRIIEQGMQKPGLQTHIHLIVSRKDISNSYSLSPGSKYRSSEVMLHGKIVKRGFDRNDFFASAEKKFDSMFSYNRNYVESFQARKTFIKNPSAYYAHLNTLTMAEKKLAFAILAQTGINLPQLSFTPNQVSFALKQLKKALEVGIRSSTIGY